MQRYFWCYIVATSGPNQFGERAKIFFFFFPFFSNRLYCFLMLPFSFSSLVEIMLIFLGVSLSQGSCDKLGFNTRVLNFLTTVTKGGNPSLCCLDLTTSVSSGLLQPVGNTPRQAGVRYWCAFSNIRLTACLFYLNLFVSTNQPANPYGMKELSCCVRTGKRH